MILSPSWSEGSVLVPNVIRFHFQFSFFSFWLILFLEIVPFSSSSTFIRRWLKSKSKKNNHTVSFSSFSFPNLSVSLSPFMKWEKRRKCNQTWFSPFEKVQTIRPCSFFLFFSLSFLFVTKPRILDSFTITFRLHLLLLHPFLPPSLPANLLNLILLLQRYLSLLTAVKQVVKNYLNSKWLHNSSVWFFFFFADLMLIICCSLFLIRYSNGDCNVLWCIIIIIAIRSFIHCLEYDQNWKPNGA